MRQIPKAEAEEIHARSLRDPVWWCERFLGDRLWQKQKEILTAVRDCRKTAVKSCHGAGKSFDAAAAALWWLYTHRDSIVLTTAPTARQVKEILWKEIRLAKTGARIPLGGTLLSQELRLADGWFALGFTAPEYDNDRFQGFHNLHLLVIADEASGISEEIYDGIAGVLTSDESRFLMIGNPTNPSGSFARAYQTPGVAKISIPAWETPNFTAFGITEDDLFAGTWEEKITGPLPMPFLVTPRWVADRIADGWTKDTPQYIAKVDAKFPPVSADGLIPYHWIEAAVNRGLESGDPAELGVDCARYGSDESVITLRRGPVARIRRIIPFCSTMELAGAVVTEIREARATAAKIDAIGIGAGVYDRLEELELPAQEMNVGGATTDPEQFANLRAEWYWGLRQRFEDGDIDIEDDEIQTAQLAQLRYKINSRGQVLIEAKDEMKRRLAGKSPDRAEALMLAFAHGRDSGVSIPLSAIRAPREIPTLGSRSASIPRL